MLPNNKVALASGNTESELKCTKIPVCASIHHLFQRLVVHRQTKNALEHDRQHMEIHLLPALNLGQVRPRIVLVTGRY